MPALTASTERGAGGISQWSPAQHPRTEGRGTSLPGGRSAELPRAEQGGVRPIPHVLCGVFVGLCALGGRTGSHRLQPAAKLTCASATSWHFEKESMLKYPGHLKQHCHTGSSRGTRGPPRVLLSPTELQGCGRRSPLSPSSGTGLWLQPLTSLLLHPSIPRQTQRQALPEAGRHTEHVQGTSCS